MQITSTSALPEPSTPPVMTIFPYQPADITCNMFKAYTKVALWQETTTGTFVQRIPDGVALVLQGNVFTITQGRHSDEGTYYCQAVGSRKIPVVFLTFYGKILSYLLSTIEKSAKHLQVIIERFKSIAFYGSRRRRALLFAVCREIRTNSCIGFT